MGVIGSRMESKIKGSIIPTERNVNHVRKKKKDVPTKINQEKN